MRTLRLAAALIAVLAPLAVTKDATARAHYPIVGFGEQRAEIFSDQHWQQLGLPHVRLVVAWDALHFTWQRREIDHWMRAAQEAGAKPLVAFTRSRVYSRRKILPPPGRFRRYFKKFRKRYPHVNTFLTWNEANHCSQPLCHKPRLAARYFDTLRSACPRCTIVAADVLDTDDMVWWLREFKRAAKHRPRIWGLHNYLDANRFRTRGTRAMLRAVKGQIWFTETGGLVKRRNTSSIRFPDSVSHAAKATRWVLGRLSRISPRIKRIYLYHFRNQGPHANWDSGVLDPKGRPRPAYRVIQRWVVRAERARRARRARSGSR